MNLGVFDSGLGGLLIARAIQNRRPDIDMVYFGDTLNLPYGNRSQETIYNYTKRGMEFLFEQDCSLIVTACNTASALVLRRLQQEFLSAHRPQKNIIGVIVPTLESAIDAGYKRLGLIATNHVVKSNIFNDELTKLDPDIKLYQRAAPLLVPLIENEGMKWADPILEEYLEPLLAENIEALILGCTHYPLLGNQIARIVGPDVKLLGQDDIIPLKLEDYLRRHPEYEIGGSGKSAFYVSDVTDSYTTAAKQIYGENIEIRHAKLGH
jgi:glutamate racemase